MEDETLISSALEGNDDAFRMLHERYFTQVFRYAYSQTSDFHRAEELTQDIFVKVARNLPRFKRKSSFRTWLFSIGYHAAIDERRKWKRKQNRAFFEERPFGFEDSIFPSAEDEMMQLHLRQDVSAGLEKLPFHYRTVLHLRFLEELSIAETAKVMSKTPAAVKALQRRAMNLMKDVMGKEEDPDEA
ncbi:MAG TPA: RNA polymerase sigma factor [Bacillales bacterium]